MLDRNFHEIRMASAVRESPMLKRGCLTLLVLLPICFIGLLFEYLPYSGISETERYALAGRSSSQMVLGRYYNGFTGGHIMLFQGRFARDKRKAVFWIETAKKSGDLSACYELPRIYEQNFPGIRNKDVVMWYAEAAQRGSSRDAARLSEVYTYGQLGQLRDPKKAAYWHLLSETNINDRSK